MRVLWVQALHSWCSKALARGRSISGGLGSGPGGTRRCGEGYSGTTVGIQVQDGVRGCGLGAWSQLALSKALQITGSQTISGAPGIGGKLAPVAAFTEPHPSGCPVQLGLLLANPKELKMPSLVAQDHSRLSCVSSTRSLWHSRKITRAPDSRPERNITALKQR